MKEFSSYDSWKAECELRGYRTDLHSPKDFNYLLSASLNYQRLEHVYDPVIAYDKSDNEIGFYQFIGGDRIVAIVFDSREEAIIFDHEEFSVKTNPP